MMQAMPDDVVAKSNGMARVFGPGRYAKDVKLDAEPMKSLIAKMAQRKIHGRSDAGRPPRAGTYRKTAISRRPMTPFVGTLPPTVERGFRQGGFVMPPVSLARLQASFTR